MGFGCKLARKIELIIKGLMRPPFLRGGLGRPATVGR